tara:strand:+ start:10201 stop:10362 length:162 start_codon:yes stop_codon:yes gene_type:complete
VYNSEENDAVASAELGNSTFKERIVLAAKGGFLVLTAILAIQIFMKAVYFAHL